MQVVGAANLWTTKPKQNNHGRRALTRSERGPAPPVTLRELDNLSSTQGRLVALMRVLLAAGVSENFLF